MKRRSAEMALRAAEQAFYAGRGPVLEPVNTIRAALTGFEDAAGRVYATALAGAYSVASTKEEVAAVRDDAETALRYFVKLLDSEVGHAGS